MKNFFKSWGLLLVAVLVAALAFYVTQNYLANTEENIRLSYEGKSDSMVDVVVASVDTEPGMAIDSSNMAIAQLDSNHLSGSAVMPDQFGELEGSILTVGMKQGEPLLQSFLQGRFIERFSDLLKVGERPVTLAVDTFSSNAGLITVGDRVDVFLRGEVSINEESSGVEQNNEESMISLFQNIRVLAVDQKPLLTKEQPFYKQNFLTEDVDQFEYSSVTLAMKADDADNLAFSASLGEIIFLLRNDKDDEIQNWTPVDRREVVSKNSKDSLSYFSFYGKNGVKQVRSFKVAKLPVTHKDNTNSQPSKSSSSGE